LHFNHQVFNSAQLALKNQEPVKMESSLVHITLDRVPQVNLQPAVLTTKLSPTENLYLHTILQLFPSDSLARHKLVHAPTEIYLELSQTQIVLWIKQPIVL
jgi:hypothetical protein